MSVATTALAVVQVASALKELSDMFSEGVIAEEEFVKRSRAQINSLRATDEAWQEMEDSDEVR